MAVADNDRRRSFARGSRLRLIWALVAVLALAGSASAAATPPSSQAGGEVARYIVSTDPAGSAAEAQLRARGAVEVQPLRHTPHTVVVLASPRAAQRIAALHGVIGVERDELMWVQHHRCGHDHPRHGPGDCEQDGQVTGTVTTTGGDPLGGATVTLTNNGDSYTAATDEAGAYTITEVAGGQYTATATADGFEPLSRTVTVDGDTVADFELAPEDDGNGDNGDGDTQPDQTTPWGIDRIDAPDAWTTSTGDGVRVCVADSGIDKNHEDLDYLEGANFSTNNPHGRNLNPDAYDDGDGHGTHVAGTIAALDNDLGVVGVAPDVDLLIAKVLRDNGSGYTSQIVDGLNWCASQGADVINMSFGSASGSATLQTAIQGIASQGVVLVAASGNSSGSTPIFPAGYEQVIAVGATDEYDQIASFSNRGEEVNAPGVAVLSTLPGDTYGTYSGTSMASPHAAGVAALIIATGEANPAKVRNILTASAEPIQAGAALRVNAANAVGMTNGS